MGWRRLPPLTAEDLTDEGWEKKRQELEQRGIDPARYVSRRLPHIIRRDPALREALEKVRARQPEKARLEAAFFTWGYRASVTGVLALLLVAALRHSSLWRNAHGLVICVGVLAGLAIVATTGYALVLFVRSRRAASD